MIYSSELCWTITKMWYQSFAKTSSLSVNLCLSQYLISVFLCFSLSVCLTIYLTLISTYTVYLLVCLPISLYIGLYICVYFFLSTFIHLSGCLCHSTEGWKITHSVLLWFWAARTAFMHLSTDAFNTSVNLLVYRDRCIDRLSVCACLSVCICVYLHVIHFYPSTCVVVFVYLPIYLLDCLSYLVNLNRCYLSEGNML